MSRTQRGAPGSANAHTINLAPLSETETDELVQGLLEHAVSDQVRRTILERAGGNPLYAEEFVRLVADRGLVDVEVGLAFPDTVQALIAARLDTLPPERKSLLQDAAVVGKVFWAGAVAAMGDRDDREVELALHELSRKELVRPARRSSVEGETEYAFWHVLVRDVAYGQIPRAARARKHRAAAAWIEGDAGPRVADLADVLAHHYDQALQLAHATDDTDLADTLLPDARRVLILAGDRALSLDQSVAAGFYARALELYDPDDAAQAPLLLKGARATATLSGTRTEAYARRAVELFKANGDELGTAEALTDLAVYVSYRGDEAEAQTHRAEAEALLERHPPSRIHALFLMRAAGHEMMAGRSRDCLAISDAAIALAEELGEDKYAASALEYRGVSRVHLGDLGGLDDLRQALDYNLTQANAFSTATAYLNLAGCTWLSIGAQQGLDQYETTKAFDESRGLLGAEMWAKAESTWVLFDLGRWDEVLTISEELTNVDEGVGPEQTRLLALPYHALVQLHRGDRPAAEALVARVLPKARVVADAQLLVPALAAAALTATAADDSPSALELVRELIDLTRARSDRYRTMFLPQITRMCTLAGAVDLAQALADGSTLDLGRVGCSRTAAAALFAEAEGRLADAAALHQQAATRWQNFGSIPGRADALLGQGRCLAALTHPGAEIPLREARELFTSIGHHDGRAEAEALLA